MKQPYQRRQAQMQAGVATAEDGFVIMDGPDGVAVTMTAEAALGTGESLIAAAAVAQSQIARRTDEASGSA